MNKLAVNLLRLICTLKYLKLGQIFWRIRKVFFPAPQIKKITVSPDLKPELKWAGISRDIVVTTDGRYFNFLGQINLIEDNWNLHHCDKLWLYNLHYHDFLETSERILPSEIKNSLIDNWILNNPAQKGVGWEPYCLSLRIVNWVKYFSNAKRVANHWRLSLFIQVLSLEKKIEYDILANHIFSNAKALIFGGVFFEGREAQRIKRLGLKILKQELIEQFLEDGGHYEASPMYHSLLMWDLCELLYLEEMTADAELGTLKFQILECLQRGLIWLESMSHPDGNISFFNDAAFDISPSKTKLLEYFELLGVVESKRNFCKHGTFEWRLFENTGYVVINGNSSELKSKTILDVGGVQPAYQPGHSHADSLSFEFSLNKNRIFVNSGTSTYNDDGLRRFQRGTLAHNTLNFAQKNSSEVWSAFRVGRRAKMISRNVRKNENGLFINAEIMHYASFLHNKNHQRTWLFSENKINISDYVYDTNLFAEVRYYVAPSIKISKISSHKLALFVNSDLKIMVSISKNASVNVENTFWYPRFGSAINNQCIVIRLSDIFVETSISW